MDRINKTETLYEILNSKTFTINVYQREYRWGRKQIEQLINDITDCFLMYYDNSKFKHEDTDEVAQYGYYFMGSIIRTGDDSTKEIVDGQQRLTSLTLLLMYINKMLHDQENHELDSMLPNMILSSPFGAKKTFNINVPERKACMDHLYKGETNFQPTDESSQTLLDRFLDIIDLFRDEITPQALPYFACWVMHKILLLEIVTPSEQEAHTIFITMNDRGLSLNSAEMLKAFVLNEVSEEDKLEVNSKWQELVNKIKSASESEQSGVVNTADVEFISMWLRGNYATSLREGKKDAEDKDYELLGEKFHEWVRQNAKKQMGLTCERLSGLHLRWGCIPFDQMPYATSLIKHNPRIYDLFECINSGNREHEFLARTIQNNTEQGGVLFRPLSELERFDDINGLIRKYNSLVYARKHAERYLCIYKDHLYMKGYVDDTTKIIKKLKELSSTGMSGYSDFVESWLSKNPSYRIDSKEKLNALKSIFHVFRAGHCTLNAEDSYALSNIVGNQLTFFGCVDSHFTTAIVETLRNCNILISGSNLLTNGTIILHSTCKFVATDIRGLTRQNFSGSSSCIRRIYIKCTSALNLGATLIMSLGSQKKLTGFHGITGKVNQGSATINDLVDILIGHLIYLLCNVNCNSILNVTGFEIWDFLNCHIFLKHLVGSGQNLSIKSARYHFIFA